MLRFKDLPVNTLEVPSTWIFENYCNLKEPLIGQDIKIKSLFNEKDKDPSMVIYYNKDKKEYVFKDFSAGVGGNAIELVKILRSIEFEDAIETIKIDYQNFQIANGEYIQSNIQPVSKFKVDRFEIDTWKVRDKDFWTKFWVGSKVLGRYFTMPLKSFTIVKDDEEIVAKHNYMYGYFKEDGTLCKIYRPYLTEKKFFKVSNYIPGEEQSQGHDYLMIKSSQKDIMSLEYLKLKMDYRASDSENVMLPPTKMEKWKDEYKKIFVMLDNDEAGIKAMKKYKELYPYVIPLVLRLSKDTSDSMKDYGPQIVRNHMVPLINAYL